MGFGYVDSSRVSQIAAWPKEHTGSRIPETTLPRLLLQMDRTSCRRSSLCHEPPSRHGRAAGQAFVTSHSRDTEEHKFSRQKRLQYEARASCNARAQPDLTIKQKHAISTLNTLDDRKTSFAQRTVFLHATQRSAINDTLGEARQQVKPFAAQKKKLRLQQVKPFAIAETGGEQRQITQLCPIEKTIG